ncbi:MAG: peptidoglycan DD-metalloendopeptidase family protein [Deltaproteobacteria bacterium]|nr:peptidoglycan DD-metalloendopeptidase family protein [Deltaproteobacteria bacterium]
MKRKAERGFTILIVPQGGNGQVRQAELSARAMQVATRGAIVAGVALLLLAGASTWALPKAAQSRRLLAENARLRAGLESTEARLAHMEALAGRVEAFDDQVRALAREGRLPGAGPLDADEMAAYEAWLAGESAPATLQWAAGEPADRALAIVERSEEIALDFDDVVSRLDALEDDALLLQRRGGALPQLWPVEGGTLTSEWGYRRSPFGGRWTMHSGIDIGVPYYTPVVATSDGTVVTSGWSGGSGRQVIIDHGEGVYTRYVHNAVLVVDEGEEVLAGQLIAYSGNSGMSTGPHLHFDLIVDGESVDPVGYLP